MCIIQTTAKIKENKDVDIEDINEYSIKIKFKETETDDAAQGFSLLKEKLLKRNPVTFFNKCLLKSKRMGWKKIKYLKAIDAKWLRSSNNTLIISLYIETNMTKGQIKKKSLYEFLTYCDYGMIGVIIEGVKVL